MLEAVIDVVLLLVSGSACLYCWVLSRRLRALQDLKKGLGASIVSLSEAISKTSVAAQEAKLSAAHSADKLTKLLSDIDKSVPVVDDLIESVHRSTRRAANETTRMQDEAVASVKPLLAEARKTANDLAAVIDLVNKRAAALKAEAQALERAAPPPGETRPVDTISMNYTLDGESDVSIEGAPQKVEATVTPLKPDTEHSADTPARQNPFAPHAGLLQALAEARKEYARQHGEDDQPEDDVDDKPAERSA